jgi:hypothetical protein
MLPMRRLVRHVPFACLDPPKRIGQFGSVPGAVEYQGLRRCPDYSGNQPPTSLERVQSWCGRRDSNPHGKAPKGF